MSQTKLTRAKKALVVLAIAGAATAFGAGSALADDHVMDNHVGITAGVNDDHVMDDHVMDDHVMDNHVG
ncbi:hypothetical protein [Streptomyces sp. I05A-00742]|uniref:hypothetical protein n=1 Tax=Streptomyces sp. I05A-00742 TaxID=2732853 RepID=UPI0014877664|nr:hypothetical protein [Streptomyces sp. I05A-00742]